MGSPARAGWCSGATAEQRKAFIDEVFRRLGEDDPTARFRQILAAVSGSDPRPPLLFLHTSLPHVPWRFLPDGRRQYAAATPGLRQGEWVGAQWQADQAFQRHLLQTEYADRLLGPLLARLRATGLYDRALIVVTADHGVSFRAGDRRRCRRRPTSTTWPACRSSSRRRASARHGVVGGVVRTIDVLPTIARELGVRLSGVDGVPAGTRGSDPAIELDVPDSWALGTTGTYGTFLRERTERRRHERALLRAAGYDPFAIGPHPELIGRRPGVVPASAGRLRLDSTEVWVSGTVEGLPADTAAGRDRRRPRRRDDPGRRLRQVRRSGRAAGFRGCLRGDRQRRI